MTEEGNRADRGKDILPAQGTETRKGSQGRILLPTPRKRKKANPKTTEPLQKTQKIMSPQKQISNGRRPRKNLLRKERKRRRKEGEQEE